MYGDSINFYTNKTIKKIMNEPKQPKRIDMKKTSFFANGKEYYITTHLSVSRFCEFQIIEKEVAFSMNFDKMFQEINEITELMNSTRFVDCAIRLDNLRRGVARLEDKEPAALKMCSLFINTADEDPAIWNQDIMTTKIEDWKTEGIAMQDFFTLALNSVTGFIDIYGKMSAGLSKVGI